MNAWSSAPQKVVEGVSTMARKRGIYHTMKFVSLDLWGNKLGLALNGRTRELLFWEKQVVGLGEYAGNFREKADRRRQALRFPKKIMPFIEAQNRLLKETPKVLDVGCGPVSILASAHYSDLIRLTATDTLGEPYKKMLEDYGYAQAMSGIRFVQSKAEHLEWKFKGEQFDIAYCHNALDHTQSPLDAFRQMSLMVKEGGYVVVSGHSREGSTKGWDSLHQHDLFVRNGVLYHESKTRDRVRLDLDVPLLLILAEEEWIDGKNSFFVVYKKVLHS